MAVNVCSHLLDPGMLEYLLSRQSLTCFSDQKMNDEILSLGRHTTPLLRGGRKGGREGVNKEGGSEEEEDKTNLLWELKVSIDDTRE